MSPPSGKERQAQQSAGPALTPVQTAVFAGCAEHVTHSFTAITAFNTWHLVDAPFLGDRPQLAAHLRTLRHLGVLWREPGPAAAYRLTLLGERLAAELASTLAAPAFPPDDGAPARLGGRETPSHPDLATTRWETPDG